MRTWPSTKASKVLRALQRRGWVVLRHHGTSHRRLGKGDKRYVFAFHDNDEIGPKMLARIAKHTGLTPDDL